MDNGCRLGAHATQCEGSTRDATRKSKLLYLKVPMIPLMLPPECQPADCGCVLAPNAACGIQQAAASLWHAPPAQSQNNGKTEAPTCQHSSVGK